MATVNHKEHKVWLLVWQLYMWTGMALVLGGAVVFSHGLVDKVLSQREVGESVIGLGAVMILLSMIGVHKSRSHLKQVKKSKRSRR
jgi:high-affinity Fe2+/Pb2+ permease